ncbi:universal stress protein [Hymenobacter caeli]|uniref:Nucleotide-binding universal stress UspA family protein n=1 Tax=Hymenobacter caeli TaxID=2735894 RepID=A0ABX2FSL9_9BACT|nr:universal stress protein [Hymenobacter caeli]NRT20188.1 nucleotide-binding universal stress UspA family protein [Hymenobacter caeli]
MKPNFVVLTDFSLAGERARAYAAALAAPLGAVLHLVHVCFPVPVTAAEYGVLLPVMDPGYVRETRDSLARVAAALPVPATAELVETDWYDAVTGALAQHRPLLVVAGLSATHGLLDEWLSNRALPLAHDTGYPLLLVPEHLPAAARHPPRRLALATEDRPFALAPQARALAPLFDALGCDVAVVNVRPPGAPAAGWNGLHAAQQCGLAAALPRSALHQVVHESTAAGILQAVAEVEADVLVLLDQGHGWVHKLFNGSVIAQVLRRTPVPVLLLSAPTGA